MANLFFRSDRGFRFLGLIVFGLALTLASPQAQAVSRAKASELALHRIERLTILKKIEMSFLNKLARMEIEALVHASAEEPSFKVIAFQVQSGSDLQKRIEIILDEEGKALSYKVLEGVEAQSAHVWGDKDSATLLENAHHWILENGDKELAAGVKVATYRDELSVATLKAGTDAAGLVHANVFFQVGSVGSSGPVIWIKLNLDGTFISAQVVLP